MNASHPFRPAAAIAALALTACISQPQTTPPKPETVAYRCADGVEMGVTYSGRATGLEGVADLIWDGQTFPLKQDVSGSGARYTDGTLTLVTKGDEAFVEKMGDVVLKDCNAKL